MDADVDLTPIAVGFFATVGIGVVAWGGDNTVKTQALMGLGQMAAWAGGVAMPRKTRARLTTRPGHNSSANLPTRAQPEFSEDL